MPDPSPKLVANRAAFKRWYHRNRETIAQRKKTARLAHLEAARAYDRQIQKGLYRKNPEKIRARNLKSYLRNRAKRLAEKKLYATVNRERLAIYKAAHYQQNKSKYREAQKQWKLNHPGEWRSMQQKYRALKAEAAVNLRGLENWMASVRRKRWCHCYWCGKKLLTSQAHFDHIVALSRGGAHSLSNLCVSCQSCNCSKSDRSVRAWVKMGQQVMEL